VLASLEDELRFSLASHALETKHDLLGRLCFLLAAKTRYKNNPNQSGQLFLVFLVFSCRWPDAEEKERGMGTHLVEDWLGLTTITALLPIVPPLSLSGERVLALLVLGDLVRGVLPAGLALAVGSSGPVGGRRRPG
jgi:uncharacterized membrane protein